MATTKMTRSRTKKSGIYELQHLNSVPDKQDNEKKNNESYLKAF